MQSLLSRTCSRTIQLGLSGLVLGSLVVLSACAGSGGPPGAPAAGPPGAPPGAGLSSAKRPAKVAAKPAPVGPKAVSPPGVKPADPKVAGVDLPSKPPAAGGLPGKPDAKAADKKEGEPDTPVVIGKIQQAGQDVELASTIISAKTNPFLSRLPKPEVAVGKGDANPDQAAPDQSSDPFAALKLLGIVYNRKAPIALVAVSGGETQSELVRKGDMLMVDDGGSVKVLAIGQDSIDLQLMGGSKEKRTLYLPALIGHSASDSSGSARAQSTSSSELSNLNKLSGKSSPADIELKEP